MNQKELEVIEELRVFILKRIDNIETSIESIKQDFDQEQQVCLFRCLLELLILVAHTNEGRKIYFKILDYMNEFDTELANYYWKLYDMQLESILEDGFFTEVTY